MYVENFILEKENLPPGKVVKILKTKETVNHFICLWSLKNTSILSCRIYIPHYITKICSCGDFKFLLVITFAAPSFSLYILCCWMCKSSTHFPIYSPLQKYSIIYVIPSQTGRSSCLYMLHLKCMFCMSRWYKSTNSQ